jgi:hypothetical protein
MYHVLFRNYLTKPDHIQIWRLFPFRLVDHLIFIVQFPHLCFIFVYVFNRSFSIRLTYSLFIKLLYFENDAGTQVYPNS